MAAELTEQNIRVLVGNESFERGRVYYQDGRIIDPQLQGDTVKAYCQGSQPQPYHVQVTLVEGRTLAASCSCRLGGYCKHVAALLLTWLHDRDAFRAVETLEAALDRRSKAELITLIRDMLDRHPDLDTLVDLRMLQGGDLKSADPETIRRQALRAFADTRHGWRASYDVAHNLRQVLALGSGYLEYSDWQSACVVYDVAAHVLIENYHSLRDEEGELLYVLGECAAGLQRCLASQDKALREHILRSLFDIYRWDVDQGGLGSVQDIPGIMLGDATPAEKRLVAIWVRDALPSDKGYFEDWRRQAYGSLLLALQEEQLDDESYLRICRETARWPDLVDRLLNLQRLDEAEAAARETSDYQLLQLADLFVAHGQADRGEQLIWERVPTSKDARLSEWLKARAMVRHDYGGALALAERLFWERSVVTDYQEVRKLAQQLGKWSEMHPKVLARLERERRFSLLTIIHLDEGRVDEALRSFERTKEGTARWIDGDLRLKVAEAAIELYPREAVRLFQEHVEHLIGGHNRGSYSEAAALLNQVRELYRNLGDEAGWSTYYSSLRERYRRLRALKEELAAAGL